MSRSVWQILFAAIVVSFALPWVSVSCQGQEMLTATGIEILTDDMQTPYGGGLASMGLSAEEMAETGLDQGESVPSTARLAVLVVLLSALSGLFMAFARPQAIGKRALVLGAAQSIVLGTALLYAPSAFRRGLRETAGSDALAGEDTFGVADSMAQMMVAAVRLEFGTGFYIALGASIALVVFAYNARKDNTATTGPLGESS